MGRLGCDESSVVTNLPKTRKGHVMPMTGPFEGRYRPPEEMSRLDLVSFWLRLGFCRREAAAQTKPKPKRNQNETKSGRDIPSGGRYRPLKRGPVIDITWPLLGRCQTQRYRQPPVSHETRAGPTDAEVPRFVDTSEFVNGICKAVEKSAGIAHIW